MLKDVETLTEAIDRLARKGKLGYPSPEQYRTIIARLSGGALTDTNIQAICWEVMRRPLARVH